MAKSNIITLKKETAYLAGVIIGDGHISGSSKSKSDNSRDYRIIIDITDKDYLRLLSGMIKSIISTKSVPKSSKITDDHKQRYYFQFRNKSFFGFLTKTLGIPKGAKSSKVQIPDKIKRASKAVKISFLAGLFDTDGGFRGNSLGFTTASQMLRDDVSSLLQELSIAHFSEEWNNKKYNRIYYGIRIRKSNIVNFLNILPLRNKEKLIRINNRF
ncbi:MAG: hypothetical protein KAT43_06805 [Nanoarchaeota archaeon]|nr:hypothetical protein [Nanoarchaeota archaeon]